MGLSRNHLIGNNPVARQAALRPFGRGAAFALTGWFSGAFRQGWLEACAADRAILGILS